MTWRPLSDEDDNRHSTYFGVWSAVQASLVSELLDSLGVRYAFLIEEQSEERLRAWMAWDLTAARPNDARLPSGVARSLSAHG